MKNKETKNIPKGVRTWVEIDTKALENNYNIFRSLCPHDCKIMAVAKSNAYGHGLIHFSKAVEKLGINYVGVDSITEALALRREEVAVPILVLGYTLPELYSAALENNISLTISSPEQIEKLKIFLLQYSNDKRGDAAKLKIHLKIDTGMHRQGFDITEVNLAATQIKKLKNIKVEGFYTHFAAAKDPVIQNHTQKQIEIFNQAIEILNENKIHPIRHAAATAGSIVFPTSSFDMVRIGIGLYGYWPSPETKKHFQKELNLKPILSWKTIVSEIKTIKAGQGIGYDFTEQFSEDSKIAILPVGYWHGLRRSLSGKGYVLIKGQKAKIVGRVCMDMVIINITGIEDISVGDVVTIIGHDGEAEITAEEIAQIAQMSLYEFITQINPLIKKVYS